MSRRLREELEMALEDVDVLFRRCNEKMFKLEKIFAWKTP